MCIGIKYISVCARAFRYVAELERVRVRECVTECDWVRECGEGQCVVRANGSVEHCTELHS